MTLIISLPKVVDRSEVSCDKVHGYNDICVVVGRHFLYYTLLMIPAVSILCRHGRTVGTSFFS